MSWEAVVVNVSPVFSLCTGTATVTQVKASASAPKALIIEPSKELAEQTLNNVNQFKKYVDNPKLRYHYWVLKKLLRSLVDLCCWCTAFA